MLKPLNHGAMRSFEELVAAGFSWRWAFVGQAIAFGGSALLCVAYGGRSDAKVFERSDATNGVPFYFGQTTPRGPVRPLQVFSSCFARIFRLCGGRTSEAHGKSASSETVSKSEKHVCY